MLLLQILNLGVEVVLELGFEWIDFFFVLSLFIDKITSQPFLLFSQLSNFKVSFFAQSYEFHVEVTDFIFLLFTVLFEFSDLKLIFFVVAEMMPFKILNLKMILVLELAYLHILHMLDISYLLLELLHLIQQFSRFEVTGSCLVDG